MTDHNKNISRKRALATTSMKAPARYKKKLWRYKYEPDHYKVERKRLGLTKRFKTDNDRT
jgi:hypothetical protein